MSKPWWSSGKIYAPGGPSSGLKGGILFLGIVDFFYFWVSSQAAMGGAQRPVVCINELKKTGASSARARTRGQNPLVYYSLLEITSRPFFVSVGSFSEPLIPILSILY
jgi:hypothetical protein